MASTAGLNSLAHSLTFGINLAVFTNLAQFIYSETKIRRTNARTHWQKWGPFYCIVGATIGVMTDLTRHLINDSNNWFLLSPTSGDRTRFDLENCQYSIPKVGDITGRCKSGGIGPLLVQEENALGIEMSMYNDDGSLSVYGWLFTIFGTWTGFILLFIGVMWYADLGNKLRRQFALLRSNHQIRNEEAHEAFLTPMSEAIRPEDVEEASPGFITPLSEPRSPMAAGS